MKCMIITESYFGNTAQVAQAIATGLTSKGVETVLIDAAVAPDPITIDADLLIIGAPTQARGLPTPSTRLEAEKRGGRSMTTGVAEWLDRPGFATRCTVAVFETVNGLRLLSGSAAGAIEKKLAANSIHPVAQKSFLIKGLTGPLPAGVLPSAEAWGASLADSAS